MTACTDDERREVAERLRMSDERDAAGFVDCLLAEVVRGREFCETPCEECHARLLGELADLIEPSYKPDAKYEAWYNNLSHFGDEQGGPSTIRELIEEIVWAALTVDLGPNGNTDPSTGIDEGDVYTNKLFAGWERDALRLSGGCDRDALLALADEMEEFGNLPVKHPGVRVLHNDDFSRELGYARRIRDALGAS